MEFNRWNHIWTEQCALSKASTTSLPMIWSICIQPIQALEKLTKHWTLIIEILLAYVIDETNNSLKLRSSSKCIQACLMTYTWRCSCFWYSMAHQELMPNPADQRKHEPINFITNINAAAPNSGTKKEGKMEWPCWNWVAGSATPSVFQPIDPGNDQPRQAINN